MIHAVTREYDPSTRPEACRNCALGAAELCEAIRDAQLPGTRPARTQRLGRDVMVVEEGDVPGFLGILRSGYLRKEKLKPSGNRTLMDLGCPGDLVGGMPGQPLPFTLETATPVEICMFDRATVERMMLVNRQFQRYLAAEISQRHTALLDMIWQRGALTSRERIISFLVKATRIMPTQPQPDGSLVVTIALARRDWADLTNTAVETVSRTMSYLAEKKLVTSLAPSTYRIRDVNLLASLAGIDPPSFAACGPVRAAAGKAACQIAPGSSRMTGSGAQGARPLGVASVRNVPAPSCGDAEAATAGRAARQLPH